MENIAQDRPPGYKYSRRDMMPLIRQLSVIDDRRNALLLAFQWAVIGAAMAFAIRVDHIAVYLLAGLIIGTRLQCLAVMMHDACHGILFSNRRVNDLIGDLFVSYPLGMSVHLYRVAHLVHHRHTNTMRDYDYRAQKKDADQQFPKDGPAMIRLFLRSVTGLNYYRVARAARVWSPLANLHAPGRFGYDFPLRLRLRYLLWAVIFYGAILASPWRWQIIALLFIPLFLWANLFNRIRAMAEHVGVPDSCEINTPEIKIVGFWTN